MPPVKSVRFKIGSMRKEVSWSVYPKDRNAPENDPMLFVQCDNRALSINTETKKGMLSKPHVHPGFHTVSKALGATEIDIPDEIIELCRNAQPKKGDTLGGGIVIIG